MDARRTPQRIVNAHPPDQRAQVRVDLRPASKGAGFPTPVMAKAGPMPTHQGLRSDDSDGPEHRWKGEVLNLLGIWRGASFACDSANGLGEPSKGAPHGDETTC